MKRYRSLLVCDQALLTREKLENDQSSNAEPLSGKPYGLPVGEGAAMPRPIRERDLVLERIKVATDAATRALSTLFAVGAVVVVVVVGGVARVTVRATATATGTATAVITIATVIAIGRATATRTIIVTGVASITVIAIVEVTVGRTTATRTIIIAIIAIEVTVKIGRASCRERV